MPTFLLIATLTQQMMEEICQLKIEKTKDKGSQHDSEHAADNEETLVGGAS